MKINNLIDKKQLLASLLADKSRNIFDGEEANKYNCFLDDISKYISSFPSILPQYKEELQVIKSMVFHSLYLFTLNGDITQNAFLKLRENINKKFENYICNIEKTYKIEGNN